MEQPFQATPRSHRWWRLRKFAYLCALIALLAGAYLFHHWFFMPEDLRRIQGNWVIVKATDGRGGMEKKVDPPDIVTFKGRTASLPGMPNESVPFDISDGTFFLCDPDNTHTILGFSIRLPLWLSRAKGVPFGTYEFRDGQLILCFVGEMDAPNNRNGQREEAQEIIFLERQ